ncbi:hypothetical protein [Oceanobacillus manasiensis]|uniref:hypothetical protein n=1 Tax=Oceanobacillus manasiensis TaxID=586413 RepID=UPI0005A73524|nr:hypothetical protein [Oceanobacillus manasiensis]
MKKKLTLGLVALSFVLMAIIGTVAYFTIGFSSEDNIAKAADFDVEAVNKEGKIIGDAEFDLDEDLVPGMEKKEVYAFAVNKNNTTVPVEYQVNLGLSGDLFPANGQSPINLEFEHLKDGTWEQVELENTFHPEQDSEEFRVMVDWPHGENDIAFQSKTGSIQLEVVATQVDEEEEEGPPYFTGEVAFKATANGATRVTEGKEINFYTKDDGYKMIEIAVGEGNGEFESRVGNVTIREYEQGGTTWFRIYTDHEYFASESQMWRVSDSSIDTSVKGKIKFPKLTGAHFTIESDALYNWFTK